MAKMQRNPAIRPGNSKSPPKFPVSKAGTLGRTFNGEADPAVHPINKGVFNAWDKRS